MLRISNQIKLRSYHYTPKYKFGFCIPMNYDQALKMDERNNNHKWRDCTRLELTQLDEYKTFTDRSKDGTPPVGYKKINAHFVYDVKHNGRHKARYVADGHKTDIPLESVYSGVVTLRGLRLVVFLEELNGLELKPPIY